MKMIALVGGQPLSNLLPALYKKPEAALLVYTKDMVAVHERIKPILTARHIAVQELLCDPFDVPSISRALQSKLAELAWSEELIFNLTGGTKAMVLAANSAAQMLRCAVLYLESQRKINRLYAYRYDAQGALIGDGVEEIPLVITLQDFLDAHLGQGKWKQCGYSKDQGGKFEEAVGENLRPHVNQLFAGVKFLGDEQGKRPQADLDIVIQLGNQFGVIEVKGTDKATLDALKQLNYLSALLGTFTVKFAALNREANKDHTAVYTETRTHKLELLSFASGRLTDADKDALVQGVLKQLQPDQSSQSINHPPG